MNRREFILAGGVFSAALLIQISSLAHFTPKFPEVEVQGRVYRGTSDGKVLISADAGKNWMEHTNFGPQYAVRKLGMDQNGLVQARLGFEGLSFGLTLENNGKKWRTV
jgi:hypothetical protein